MMSYDKNKVSQTEEKIKKTGRPAAKEALTGTVESIIFQGADHSFAVFRLREYNARAAVTVAGNFPAPLQGEEISVTGNWVEHARFGRQFKAETYAHLAPSSQTALERLLASSFLKGVGSVMAARLVGRFGNDILEIIKSQPERLTEVKGVGKKTARQIQQSYLEHAELREIMFFLETHGISGAYAARIYDVYGANAIEKIKDNPYQVTEDVKDIGFNLADQLALSAGIAKNNSERIVAGIKFMLSKINLSGHCCVPEKILVEKAAEFLALEISQVSAVFKNNPGRFCLEDLHGMNLIYPEHLYFSEKKVAERLLSLQSKAAPVAETNVAELIGNWENREAISLSKEQKEALTAAMSHGVMALTGGPGTGKTTIVKGILALLAEQRLKILLGAPTGRAAKRLSETSGREAMTVHRLLEAGGGVDDESVFFKDETNPLDADAIIIDEASMMDIILMGFLLRAVPDGCRVILVGDADQLPAVGPGSVLKDIIRSKVVPVIKLTEVFRQSAESLIVVNAHRINQGSLPECNICPDFQFRQIDNPEKTAEAIVALCAQELKEEGFDIFREVQVLSPMHRQVCGVENLNKLLQTHLNPPDQVKSFLSVAGQILREGDKVMQTRNNYTKRVFNGDIGYILAIDEGEILVRYPEDDVFYERGEQDEIALAYAMSVHKSQGSEYGVVIMPLALGHQIMLQRNLLYTAVTRAKERVILLGSAAALRLAVQNDRARKRYSLLAERLKGELPC